MRFQYKNEIPHSDSSFKFKSNWLITAVNCCSLPLHGPHWALRQHTQSFALSCSPRPRTSPHLADPSAERRLLHWPVRPCRPPSHACLSLSLYTVSHNFCTAPAANVPAGDFGQRSLSCDAHQRSGVFLQQTTPVPDLSILSPSPPHPPSGKMASH